MNKMGRLVGDTWQVRCPRCNRLACHAAQGSRLQVKCSRCAFMFEFPRGVAPDA